jgi:hypothetical protein
VCLVALAVSVAASISLYHSCCAPLAFQCKGVSATGE